MSSTINPSTIIKNTNIKQQTWSKSNKSCPNIFPLSIRPCKSNKLNNPTHCEYLKTIMCKIVHYILVQFFNIKKYIRVVLRYTIFKIFEYY